MTRTQVNNTTSLSTTRVTDYFNDINPNLTNGSTTTTQRSWNNIQDSANYLFLKGSYATEYLELVLRLGMGDKRITYYETDYADTAQSGMPDNIGQGANTNTLVSMAQGFAYGFNVRGEPYQTDDFQVLMDAHYTEMFNKGYQNNSYTCEHLIDYVFNSKMGVESFFRIMTRGSGV